MNTSKSLKAVAPPTADKSLLVRIAERYHVDADKMGATLKATAFRSKSGEISNEQLMMLLVVADQYKLNPFTAELFAFPSSERGIVPIVSVDGWIRIVNERPELESISFGYSEDPDAQDQWISCTIRRRDRAEPLQVREYMDECKRNTGPWNSHPRRMLRHKAFIQCARLAFGFGGIYDPDEGERIIESTVVRAGKPATKAPEALPAATQTYTSVPVDELRKELDASGYPESEFFGHFEIGALGELPLNQVQAAFDLLRSVNAN